MPVRRDIYLKIEPIANYNPVVPDDADHMRYGLDCMRNTGHEDGRVPATEIAMRQFDALVYREYLDPAYTTPNTAPLISADVNEPPWSRRVPGAVIYTEPGERLFVHVLNGDTEPHSLHLHGLLYGIDSDGSWPFGVASPDGRRSDEICPGQEWIYIFDATEETIGAWPFHDHHMRITPSVGRGLFGAIVVRDPEAEKADYEVPLFLHQMSGSRDTMMFDSGTLHTGDTYAFTFPRQGDFTYQCRFHSMTGVVHVTMGGPASARVHIRDNFYDPADVTVGVGGTVTWENNGMDHTATERGGGSMTSFALNGRTFVGNTPTIVVESGKRIRWYVCSLDLQTIWHNFHIHGQRWRFADGFIDTRSLSPAESFVADTIVPPVVILGDRVHKPKHKDEREDHDADEKRRKVRLRGDFLVHCHVEDHMMEGMTGLVRVIQEVRISREQERKLGLVLSIDHGGNDCPDVDMSRCAHVGSGRWESLPDSPVFIVHAALLHTGKVLLWSGGAESGYPNQSILFDATTHAVTVQAFDQDLFCAGHAFLEDGRLLVAGGSSTPGTGIASTHIFDPGTPAWSHIPADMGQPRWYPTLLTLANGHVLAISGRGGNMQEVFDGAAWNPLLGADRNFPELYPSNHLLPTGDVFYSRAGWNAPSPVNVQTGYLHLGVISAWTDLGTQAFSDRQEGTAVLQIDDRVSPPATQIFIFGGGYSIRANAQSCEIIDVTRLSPAPVWRRGRDMAFRRVNVNAVLLPDGTILIIGGHQGQGRFGANNPVLQAELYDPRADSWATLAAMAHPRGYHSVAVLLPDGRVLSTGGTDGFTNQHNMELFTPPYLFAGPRPNVTAASATVAWGGTIDIDTPDGAAIDQVVLLRPASETHHTDGGMRRIRLAIIDRPAGRVRARAPGSGTVAPPGYYQLFVVSLAGVPSVGRFIRVHA